MHHLFLLALLCLFRISHSFRWFSSSSSSSSSTTPPGHGTWKKDVGEPFAEFFMGNLDNPKGVKLLENARNKLIGPRNCWQDAYQNLFSSCSEIMADKEKQSRLAWDLSNCFQEDSGRSMFPHCDAGVLMVHCRKKLSDFDQKIFLEFFLETNTLCHQLQAEAFKHGTEKLVNDLTRSSRFAEDKLEIIGERSEQILKESSKVHDSIASIEVQTQQLAQASREVEDQINDVLEHSKVIIEQSKEIAASQSELKEEHLEMREKLESGMARLEESYEILGNEMDKLKKEAMDIEKEIKVVGNSMSSKMQDLQSTANDIGDAAGMSLEKQKRLLDGQAVALEGLDILRKFQSQALEESRETIQKLAELGQKQQEELLLRQEQIQQAHELLIQNSQSILAAQEEFELKQANIFSALDKLFALHNAILIESRFIKSFFFYSCVIFLLYMLTSAKQTFGIRGRLYFGLCITLVVELGLVRLREDDFSKQNWIMSKVFLTRIAFLAAAAIQVLHSIFTYRDYEVLNHQLLQTLVEKVRAIEENSGNKLLSYSTESDESISNYSWICKELPEDIDSDVDPNYILPEEVSENYTSTTSITRRYDLRPRRRQ
ncbi:protein GAMETE EXPRESSED 1 [Typha latifolia]|uniref:protein GAMETE EXPRESSED 1 n=1 Tax=Typha latifolia TaxID=4733 RepID=UPI003C2C2768